jgi:D-alanyl-D-alanine carboxypeptidase
MTLGWHFGNLEEIQYFYKEGGGAGFHCEMRIYPAIGLVSVIMTNNTSFNTRKQLSRIDKIFVDKSDNKISSDAP